MRAITEITGDTAIVRGLDTRAHERLAGLLLTAAGPERIRDVQITSQGGRGFRVPLDIARAAGLIPADPPIEDEVVDEDVEAVEDAQESDDTEDAPADEQPVKAPTGKATRTRSARAKAGDTEQVPQ